MEYIKEADSRAKEKNKKSSRNGNSKERSS